MKLVIDRHTWMRGSINRKMEQIESPFSTTKKCYETSVLLNSDGCMCCLGFLCIQNGLTEAAILNMPLPSAVQINFPKTINWLFNIYNENNFIFNEHRLADINDDITLTEKEREQILTEEFAKHNVEIEFIGE